MSKRNAAAEAVLYYLYITADGEVSCDEEKLFDKICKELRISVDEKNNVLKKCQTYLSESQDLDVLKIIKKKMIDSQANKAGTLDQADRAQIIWNLVNLGYADTFYSEQEKAIMNYLVQKWGISEEIYQEMLDTAETVASLVHFESWVEEKFSRGESIRYKKKRETEEQIKQLVSDIMLTIEELEM